MSSSSESASGEESDTQQFDFTGQLAYQFEPEYTLQEYEADHARETK